MIVITIYLNSGSGSGSCGSDSGICSSGGGGCHNVGRGSSSSSEIERALHVIRSKKIDI